MRDKILAIDQGTSSTKAMLFDLKGAILGKGEKAHFVHNRENGYVEQDPEELFQAAVSAAMDAMGSYTAGEVAALGLSAQTGAFLLWNKKTGKPLSPVISWQCRRGRAYLKSLSAGEKQQFLDIVSDQAEEDGVPAKLAQVFKEDSGLLLAAREDNLLFGTMESWLLFGLSGGKSHKSDVTNACITRLFLEEENCWNTKGLEFLGVPAHIFPKVVDNDAYLGTVAIPGLEGIPIYGSMGDSAAAMFGEGCQKMGQSKITYGTGASWLIHLGEEPRHSSLNDVFLGWRVGGRRHYVWEGTLPHVGSTVKWLGQLGVIENPAETEELAKELSDNGGVYFLPEVTVDGREQNIFLGMDFRTDRRHLARAVLESIAFRIRDMKKPLEEAGFKITGEIRADGGMAANDFLMQFQADILNCDITCNPHPDISAYGAFLLAALSSGMMTMEEITGLGHQSRSYRSSMPARQREKYLGEWEQAKERLR